MRRIAAFTAALQGRYRIEREIGEGGISVGGGGVMCCSHDDSHLRLPGTLGVALAVWSFLTLG